MRVTQERLLFELADFQFLTVSQAMRLIGLSSTAISDNLSRLAKEKNPTVACQDYMNNGRWGRNESIYYLTAAGVKVLEQRGLSADQIKFPKGRRVAFTSDYHHRIWTVDVFIALKLYAKAEGHELEYFSYYFQQNAGSNRHNKGGKHLSDNRIDVGAMGMGYVVPDGVFMLRREGDKPIFGLVEQHNGDDTSRAMKQIEAHCVALSKGAASLAFDAKHEGEYVGNRVFFSFELENYMRYAMHRFAKSAAFEDFGHCFLFRSAQSIREGNFEDEWVYANGAPFTLR